MQVPLTGWRPAVSRADTPLSDPAAHWPDIRLGSGDPAARTNTVLVDGLRVTLTEKEFTLLKCLAQQRGVPQSADEILEYIYNDLPEPRSRVLPVFVSRLRAKLAAAGAHGLLVYRKRHGYVLLDAPSYAPDRACELLMFTAA